MPPLSHKQFPHWLRIAFIGVARAFARHARSPAVSAPLAGCLQHRSQDVGPARGCFAGGRSLDGRRRGCSLRRPQGAKSIMDAKAFDKSKLPSRHVTEGPSRAPHRSYYYAMGLTEEQIHRPFVGVVSCWNEAAPCNIALMRQAQSAKKGVDAGRRHAARVLHHHRHRRHRHGPPGHEVVAGLARGDRRLRSSSPCAATATTPWSASPAATRRCPA